jgi:hypothetical protein
MDAGVATHEGGLHGRLYGKRRHSGVVASHFGDVGGE